MRTFTLILLAVTLLAVAPVRCGAQVYAVGTHRGPMVTLRVDEHTWLIGGWPNGYGLLQFRSRTGEGAPWLRSTTICLGRPVLTVRLPAVLVAASVWLRPHRTFCLQLPSGAGYGEYAEMRQTSPNHALQPDGS